VTMAGDHRGAFLFCKKFPVIFAIATLACAAFAPQAKSQSVWNAVPGASASTNWSTAANWTPGGVPGPTTIVAFNDTASEANNTTINSVVDKSFGGAISSLSYANSNNFENTLIAGGVTLNITGIDGLTNGSGTLYQTNLTSYGTTIFGAGATLNISNPIATIFVGWGNGYSSGQLNGAALLNLSNLDTFTATITNLMVGQTTGQTTNRACAGILYLARTNYITALMNGSNFNSAIVIGDNNNNPGTNSTLYLGQNNVINADSIGCGLRKQGNSADVNTSGIQFNPVFTNNNPVAYLRASDGVNAMGSWTIGDALYGQATARGSGYLDFSGGTINALVSTIVVGRTPAGGTGGFTGHGRLTLTGGMISVMNLTNAVLANPTNTTQEATGVVTVNGTGVLAVSGNLTMGALNGNTGASSGTLNITNGTVEANMITAGGGTSTINLSGGTFVVSNTAGLLGSPLTSLNMTNGTVAMSVADSGITSVEVGTLNVGGTDNTNTINITTLPQGAYSSAEYPLIGYANEVGTINFNLGTIPYPYQGYISNNVTASRIDLVITNGPPTSVFSNLTVSQIITYGTSNITLSGNLSAPGPLYPAQGETITVNIDGNAQTTTINDLVGNFSINYNPSAIPASGTPYIITYSYAGDALLHPASDNTTTLTVLTNNGNTPVFSNLTSSRTVPYGTTNIALSGKLSAPGPLYPAQGETIAVSINGNAQKTTINDSTGDFSINYNPSAIPASGIPYAIIYSYAGDASLNPATDASTTLTIGKAGLFALLTGDNTTINADWSATENGIHYYTVMNGSPFEPWIVYTQHFVGDACIGIQVPAGNGSSKERFEYAIMQYNLNTNTPGFNTSGKYCGFAFMLVGSPPLEFTNSSIIWQAWQGTPWGPPAMLKFLDYKNSPPFELSLAIRNMTTGPCSCIDDTTLWSSIMIYPNRWYNVVVYIQPCYQTGINLPGYNTNGIIALWIDGTNYVNWSGEIGYDPTKLYNTNDGSVTTNTAGSAGVNPGFFIKDGVYQSDANNGHTVYFDQIAVANNYNDANPVRPPTLTNLTVANGASMSIIGDTVANYAGTGTANYTIQSSTNLDLTNWTTLIITNPASLPFSCRDTSGSTNVAKFYRASVWPK